MELLAPIKNLQRYSVRQIEELFPELHGWGRGVDLNDSGLPPGAVFACGQDGEDYIGLSASALLAALPPHHRSIYFTDPSNSATKKSDADILVAIAASIFLNDGGELMGDATKGYAQFADGTASATLDKAYRYYNVTRPAAYATDIKSLVTAVDGALASPVGPAVVYSAAAGQVPDGNGGVQSSAIPPVHAEGYYGGPAITCLFTNPPTAPEVKTLTAQKYCLQCADGSVSCGYGTATPGSPLQFTATAGDTTFTPTGCTNWMLTASGGYVFELIPCGQSVVSTAGSTAGNGVSVPLSGNDTTNDLIECFRGVPDGVEKVINGTFDTTATGWGPFSATAEVVAGEAKVTAGQTGGDGVTQAITVVAGKRYLFTGTLKNGNATDVKFRVRDSTYSGAVLYDSPDTSSTSSTTYVAEVTALSNTIVIYARVGATAIGQYGFFDNISLQELTPAVGTAVAIMRMGVNNADIASGPTLTAFSTNGSTTAELYVQTSLSRLVQSFDGTGAANSPNSATWARGEYHLRVVEFGSSKFRVGYQRYNENGTTIDSDIVWSHATLAGAAAFDGSFNPTTFLRWMLNNALPNHMRCTWASNQNGLGNTEIIKRTRKYGKF